MKTQLNKQERMQQIVDVLFEGCKTHCAHAIGMSVSALSNRMSRGSIDYDRVILHLPNINPEWLLTGRGKMLKDNWYNQSNEQ